MTDVDQLYALSEQLRGELRATVTDTAAEYVTALERVVEAERRYAQDPDRDDRQAEAKDARAELDDARKRFDDAVAAAKGVRTRKLNDAVAAAEA